MTATHRSPVPRVAVRRWPSPAETFRPDVEGLRAVAVLLVIAGHVFGVPRGGYVGVDVFFVISGFLITGLLLREHDRTGRIRLRDFYARRVRRLIPAAVLVLAVTNVAAYLLFAGERAGQALRDSVWALGFLANVRFTSLGTDYFDETRPVSPVQHYWSLAVEEQFYIVWPAVLLLALWLSRRAGPAVVLVLLTAGSLVWALHQTATHETVAYFATPARAWELGLGALLAVGARAGYVQHLPRRVAVALGWLGLGGILLSAFLLTEQTPFPGVAALIPTASTALVLQAGEAGAANSNPLLVNPLSQYLGRLSYSLYLWHWPVLILGLAVLPSSLTIVVPLVATAVLAVLSHHLVEEPVRRSAWLAPAVPRPTAPPVGRRARRVAGGNRAVVATAAAAAVVAVGFVLPALGLNREAPGPAASAGSPPAVEAVPLPTQIADSLSPASWPPLDPPLLGIRFAGSPEWIVDKCDNVNSGNVARCRYGPREAPRTAALVGDSIAVSWLPALREVLEPRGFSIQVLTRNQCPAPQVMFFRERPEEPFTNCADHKEWVIEQVRALEPDLVLVSNSLTFLDKQVAQPQGAQRYERWRQGMAQTLTRLAAAADEVVVLGAPPRAGNVQECVTRLSEPADCTEPVPEEWKGVRAAEQAAARAAGASYVDPEPWFCVQGRCPAVVGSTPVYTDGRHLTAAYARRLVPQVERALEAERWDVTEPA